MRYAVIFGWALANCGLMWDVASITLVALEVDDINDGVIGMFI